MTENTTPNTTASGAADDSLLLCATDLEHSAIYDNPHEMVDCVRAVADRITALAASAPAPQPSPTAGMNMVQRILHVGGRNPPGSTYVEFGSIQAVEALVKQVQRDLPRHQCRRLPDHEIVTMYAECPSSDAEMLDFAHELMDAMLAPTLPAEQVATTDDPGPLLDDDGRAMVANSHHYTPEDIRALVKQLRAFSDPQQTTQADWDSLDWRGHCNVLWRVMSALADEVVPAPLQQGEYPETLYEGGRESVDDALAVVESFGPGVQGLNDTFARQVLLGQEVRRLRAAYEHACQGRSDFRNLYRAARGAAQAAPAPVAEDAEIRKALHDAATSLETISSIAGRDRYMLGMMDVRLYAASRAKVAREAQAAQPEGGA